MLAGSVRSPDFRWSCCDAGCVGLSSGGLGRGVCHSAPARDEERGPARPGRTQAGKARAKRKAWLLELTGQLPVLRTCWRRAYPGLGTPITDERDGANAFSREPWRGVEKFLRIWALIVAGRVGEQRQATAKVNAQREMSDQCGRRTVRSTICSLGSQRSSRLRARCHTSAGKEPHRASLYEHRCFLGLP